MNRTRTTGAISRATYRTRDFYPNGQSVSDTTTVTSSGANGFVKTVTDVVTPGFSRRRNKGEIIMSPFSMSSDQRESSYNSYDFGVHPIWGRRLLTGELACIWSIAPSAPSWFNSRIVDWQLLTMQRAQARVAESSFASLVTVAEAHKTASMMARPLKESDDLLTKMFTRRAALMKKGLDAVKAGTSAYLEYRFGWKPVLYEMEGICDAYIDRTKNYERPTRLVARAGSGEIEWSLSNEVYTGNIIGALPTMSRSAEYLAKVSSGILYEIQEDLVDASRRRMGLRVSDVPSSVWELVPYSFVVDRFIDLSTWLKAIVPVPNVAFRGAWTTTVIERKHSHSVVKATVTPGNSPITTYTQSGGSYSEQFKSINRSINPGLPLPPLVNPKVLSLVQTTDHVALVAQRLLNLNRGNLKG